MNQLITRDGELVQQALPLTPGEIIARRHVITEVLQKVMQDGVHYGRIPGTQNKSLLKPGADLLLSTFHIAADPEVEDLSGPQEIRYRVRLRGLAMGTETLVGVGLGEASSNEEKYRWKKTNRREWDSMPENMRRIKYTTWDGQEQETKQIRSNPYDQVNTILKMAKKRASVDLVLTALAAAEVFDDIDKSLKVKIDDPVATQGQEPDLSGVPGGPPTTVAPAAGGDDIGKQLYELRQACDKAGLRDIDVMAHCEVAAWGDLKTPEQLSKAWGYVEAMQP